MLDRSAPHGTLARSLVQLGTEADERPAVAAPAEPALTFEWSSLPPGARLVGSQASVRVDATARVVYAPRILAKLGAFFASASEYTEALLLQQVRSYMRRLTATRRRAPPDAGDGGRGAGDDRREDLLVEIAKDFKRVGLDMRLAGARLLSSSDLTDASAPALAVDIGPIRVATALVDESVGVAPPATAAAVAVASLTAAASDAELDAVRSALYHRLEAHVDYVHLHLLRRPSEAAGVVASGKLPAELLLASTAAPRATRLAAAGSGGSPTSSSTASPAASAQVHGRLPLCSCGGGIDLDVDLCILPAGSHGLPQTRVVMRLLEALGCDPEALEALGGMHDAAVQATRCAATERATEAAFCEQLALHGAPQAALPPARQQAMAAAAARKVQRAAELAAARGSGFIDGVASAQRCMRSEALSLRLSAEDSDALLAICAVAADDTSAVRQTFRPSELRSASLPVEPRATFSPPPTAEVLEALAIFGSAVSEAAPTQPMGRVEARLVLPSMELVLFNNRCTLRPAPLTSRRCALRLCTSAPLRLGASPQHRCNLLTALLARPTAMAAARLLRPPALGCHPRTPRAPTTSPPPVAPPSGRGRAAGLPSWMWRKWTWSDWRWAWSLSGPSSSRLSTCAQRA